MAALRGVSLSAIVTHNTSIDAHINRVDNSILSVRLGDYETGEVALQGDPVEVLAFAQRLYVDVLTAVLGQATPILEAVPA